MSSVSVDELSPSLNQNREKTNKVQIRQFDLKIARDSFVNCVQQDNLLLLSEYVNAYDELCIFVASLGSIFEWAIKDLSNKLLVLREHIRIDPINYRTIQSMVTFEVQTDRIKTRDTNLPFTGGKLLPNGSRTLLRLHRALAFISSFLSQMRLAPDDASSATIAWNAYSVTMARFHSWPVRCTIQAALRLTLPSRSDLINKLISRRAHEEIDQYAQDIVEACNTIEQTTQDLFNSYQINRLP